MKINWGLFALCILSFLHIYALDLKDPQTLARIIQEIELGQLTREKEELYSKHLRVLFLDDEYQRVSKATILNLFIKMRDNICKEFPIISDVEYQAAHESVGVALYKKSSDYEEQAIEVMIRDAYCLSMSAYMMLKFIYEINPHYQTDARILLLFKTIAQEGSPRGQLDYGDILLNGMGIEKNINEGVRYLQLASDACVTEAHKKLAFYYHDQGNEDQFEYYMHLAAQDGDVQSIYNLGVTEQIRKNYKEAINYFNQVLELDPTYYNAKLELGRMYVEGWGVPVWEEKGFNMIYEVAQKTDDEQLRAIAYLNLGIFYQRGIGTKKSLSKAKKYFKKAADLGLEDAQKYLKSCL